MSSKRLDPISDYYRHGFDLQVVCQGCGRATLLDSRGLTLSIGQANRSRDMGAVRTPAAECRVRQPSVDMRASGADAVRVRSEGKEPRALTVLDEG